MAEQPVAMRRMAAGIDQDQPFQRVEKDRIPVRPPIGLQRPGNDVVVRRPGGLRTGTSGGSEGEGGKSDESGAHGPTSPCPYRPAIA